MVGMGLRPLYIYHSFSAGINFRLQNLTFTESFNPCVARPVYTVSSTFNPNKFQ